MVTVYTTPKCMGCMLTKKWLTDRSIPFESVDLTDPANINDYQAIRALGHTSAPVVAVGQGYSYPINEAIRIHVLQGIHYGYHPQQK